MDSTPSPPPPAGEPAPPPVDPAAPSPDTTHQPLMSALESAAWSEPGGDTDDPGLPLPAWTRCALEGNCGYWAARGGGGGVSDAEIEWMATQRGACGVDDGTLVCFLLLVLVLPCLRSRCFLLLVCHSGSIFACLLMIVESWSCLSAFSLFDRADLVFCPEQLARDYGAQQAGQIVAGLREAAVPAAVAGALAWPGVGTRWRRFLSWLQALAGRDRPADARTALAGFARAVGRVRSYRALALDDEGLRRILAEDEIFPSGR
eukprot:SAG11_NODE_2458_length_3338_cov_4.659463_2_plen_261_part_00